MLEKTSVKTKTFVSFAKTHLRPSLLPMEFTLIDQELDARYRKILRQIHRLQSGGTIDSLQTVGADVSRQIGASYVSLKELASHYETDLQLALLLWNTRRREEQIVGCMLFPVDMNKEKITQLLQTCLNFEVAEYFGSLYLYKYPGLSLLAEEWQASDIPYQQTAILAAIARHMLVYKNKSKIDISLFKQLIHRNYREKYVQLMAERHRFNI